MEWNGWLIMTAVAPGDVCALQTWQLSRYTLGLTPRYDVGVRHFDLKLYTTPALTGSPTLSVGGPTAAALAASGGAAVTGRVPCREGDAVVVSWKLTSSMQRQSQQSTQSLEQQQVVDYTLTIPGSSEGAIWVRGWGGAAVGVWTKIEGSQTCTLTVISSP